MTSPVTKAMIESYALMILVMGTFFVYFCGMVWAFCNPKLSGDEEEPAASDSDCWVCAPDHGAHTERCSAHRAGDCLARTTYINFSGDADSLLDHGAADLKTEEHSLWHNL